MALGLIGAKVAAVAGGLLLLRARGRGKREVNAVLLHRMAMVRIPYRNLACQKIWIN